MRYVEIKIKKQEGRFEPFSIELSHTIIVSSEYRLEILKQMKKNKGGCGDSICAPNCPFNGFEHNYGAACEADIRSEILDRIDLDKLEVIK